jgi:hypothetical protein
VNGMLLAAAYAPPLRASMVPVVLKRTEAAIPVNAVCAPLLKDRMSLAGEIEGLASKVAVKVPVWLVTAVLVKPLLLLIVAALAAREVPAIAAPITNALMPRMVRTDTRPETGGDTESPLGAGVVIQFIVFLRYGLLQLL